MPTERQEATSGRCEAMTKAGGVVRRSSDHRTEPLFLALSPRASSRTRPQGWFRKSTHFTRLPGGGGSPECCRQSDAEPEGLAYSHSEQADPAPVPRRWDASRWGNPVYHYHRTSRPSLLLASLPPLGRERRNLKSDQLSWAAQLVLLAGGYLDRVLAVHDGHSAEMCRRRPDPEETAISRKGT